MLNGWLVILGDKDNLSVTPTSIVKNLLKKDEETELIPIFTRKIDAEYYSALFCKENENIKNVAIVDVSTLLKKGKVIVDQIVKDGQPKPSFIRKIKKFFNLDD